MALYKQVASMPHSSSAPLSRDFSKDTTPDTIERRENYKLADGPLKELSWKGTLGVPPAELKKAVRTSTAKRGT